MKSWHILKINVNLFKEKNILALFPYNKIHASNSITYKVQIIREIIFMVVIDFSSHQNFLNSFVLQNNKLPMRQTILCQYVEICIGHQVVRRKEVKVSLKM